VGTRDDRVGEEEEVFTSGRHRKDTCCMWRREQLEKNILKRRIERSYPLGPKVWHIYIHFLPFDQGRLHFVRS